MKHIELITTSYPNRNPGSEVAGSFVEDFAEVLSRHLNVTVLQVTVISANEWFGMCFAAARAMA